MKNAGWVLSLIGVLIAVYAFFFMDVSVALPDGTRVNNIGLLSFQQNLIIVSAVLFIGGVIAGAITGRKQLPDVKYKEPNEFSPESFLLSNDGENFLNKVVIDEFSIVLLKKHGRSSISDIMLMNGPYIDKVVNSLPDDLKKEFRRELTKRLKSNS
ncbi:hypothetical protein [Enterobacter oligotrophicus]|uniref:hypothetical protein n=1 Tax=Enterobacter oligotrophicus TaxID=2478464 RepID=UPI0028B02BD7|nr:hypothetical protein [Enterobacter oligotrophicus]